MYRMFEDIASYYLDAFAMLKTPEGVTWYNLVGLVDSIEYLDPKYLRLN